MGLAKQLMADQADRGFATDRHLDEVCEHCINDEGLARFASRCGVVAQCAYCGSTGSQGMRLGGLFSYMAGCLEAEWSDPLNVVAWDKGWDPGVLVYESDELLDQLDEPLGHPDLRQAFVDAFDRQWCVQSPYQLEHSRMLALSWARFSDLVRTRHRFLFLMRQHEDADTELVPPGEMLDSVGQAIDNARWRMLHRIPAGTAMFRARHHHPRERPRTATQLGSPPPHRAKANRMSPVGIPMFYAADDPALAVEEIRPTDRDAVTWARWTTTREMWCLDLANALPIPSLFDMTGGSARPWLRFLAEFGEDLSKPALDDSGTAYIPTQVVTEYVRDVLGRTSVGAPIEAIRYASSIDPSRRCWVVFAGPDECADLGSDDLHRLVRLDPATISSRQPRSWWRRAMSRRRTAPRIRVQVSGRAPADLDSGQVELRQRSGPTRHP